jgi:hypothetical protein
VRLRGWLLALGGFVALLFAYAGGRAGTHQWCGGPDGGPVYCEYTTPHHQVYLALGLVLGALAVLLFFLASVEWATRRSAAEPTT